MQNRKSINDIPEVVLSYTMSFLPVKTVARSIPCVSKDWKRIMSRSLPNVICAEIGVTKNQLSKPPVEYQDWTKAYVELREHKNKEHKVDQLTKEIDEIDPELVEMNNLMRQAAMAGYQAAPLIFTKKSCLVCTSGGACSSVSCYLLSLVACPELTCLSTFMGGLFGCSVSGVGYSAYADNKNKRNKKIRDELNEQLNAASIPLLELKKEEPEESLSPR